MRRGEFDDQVLFFDGEILTFYSPADNAYAAVEASGTIDSALDLARDELDLVAPAADLIYSDAFDGLTQDLTEGFVVSDRALLNGQACTHLAFRKPGVDYQIWIRNGDRPLPLKMVLTTTDLAANPQFVVTVTDWNVDPSLAADPFLFVPPAEAQGIEFLRVEAGSESSE